MFKKIILLLIFLLLIMPISANSENYFDDWYSNYYNPNNTHLDNLNISNLNQDEFLDLSYIYEKVYSNLNASQIKNKMVDDFKSNDLDNDGILTINEFEKFLNPIYEYYLDDPDDYEYFKDTDLDNDSLISQDEFEEISYTLSEDSFWDGFSIEEITQSEFDQADSDANHYLNFTEFKIIGI